MTRLVNLDEAIERPLKHWHQDGLPQLMLGLMMLAGGGLFLVGRALPEKSLVAQTYAFVGPIIWAVCCLALRWGLIKLKAAVASQRAGYVAFRRPKFISPAFWVAVALIAGASIFLLYANRGLPEFGGMAGPGLGIVFAACLLVGGLQYKWPYMVGLAVFSLLLGGLAYVAGAGWDGGLWVMAGLGAAIAVWGASQLRGFLKAHPRTVETQA